MHAIASSPLTAFWKYKKMKNFSDIINNYNWDSVREQIYSKNEADVLRALNSSNRNIEDFMALVSPAASFLLSKWHKKSFCYCKTIWKNNSNVYSNVSF